MSIVAVNGVDLVYQTFGHPNDPAILLIGGQGSSMDGWDTELCQRIAAGGRYVLRYDQRDTGGSTSYPTDEPPPYGLAELGEDGLALLAELDHQAAHVVGISQGGAVAMYLAVRHPERVRSLTLIATGAGGPGSDGLPPMSDRLQVYFSEQNPPDLDTRESYVQHLLQVETALSGAGGIDADRVRAAAEATFDRSADVRRAYNHQRMRGIGFDLRAALGTITAPTLVVQGAEDELFAPGHSAVLAAEIPGAELITLSGMGHQAPPATTWAEFVPALLRHTSGGWDAEAGRLARRGHESGDAPTDWFDRIYRAGDEGAVDMPWNRTGPEKLLADWLSGERGHGRAAVVVGCGLGADAEFLAELGWSTVGFDVSPNAIRLAEQRHPGSKVKYRAASLFELPSGWRRAFDLVVEIYTVQALPRELRSDATAAVGSLVGPGGRLLVVQGVHGSWPGEEDLPPWPLTAEELAAFAQDGLSAVEISQIGVEDRVRWRGVFRRSESA